jgi:toxin HigB-1
MKGGTCTGLRLLFTVLATFMMGSFRCPDTERLFRRFRSIERQALRKLEMLDAAPDLRTLAGLPGNRLERLKGDC